MSQAGYAHMGVGTAKGKDKAVVAATQAISSPLLETSIAGAKGIIISFVASEDIDIEEIEQAAEKITESASEDANITWGIVFNPDLDDELTITVIATGFDNISNNPKNSNTNPFYTPSKAEPADLSAPAAPKKSAGGPAIPTFDAADEISSGAPAVPGADAPAAESDEDEFYSLINDLINKDKK
jgi:cell division protein FtsZ